MVNGGNRFADANWTAGIFIAGHSAGDPEGIHGSSGDGMSEPFYKLKITVPIWNYSEVSGSRIDQGACKVLPCGFHPPSSNLWRGFSY